MYYNTAIDFFTFQDSFKELVFRKSWSKITYSFLYCKNYLKKIPKPYRFIQILTDSD
jgi:hypothetical protein